MTDWNVTVQLESNYIKTIRVDDCFDRNDAERQAQNITGAKKIVTSCPVSVYSESNKSNGTEFVDTGIAVDSSDFEIDYDDIEERYDELDKLDEMEEEMYSLMCKIAIENDEELPTIKEFYDYLGK